MGVRVPSFAPDAPPYGTQVYRQDADEFRNFEPARAPAYDGRPGRYYRPRGRGSAQEADPDSAHAGLPARQSAGEAGGTAIWPPGAFRGHRRGGAEGLRGGGARKEPACGRLPANRTPAGGDRSGQARTPPGL